MNEEPILCEGHEDKPLPAVASLVMMDSRSAANIAFVCEQCLAELMKEWALNPEDCVGWEVRLLAAPDPMKEVLDLLDNVPVRFWSCANPEHKDVQWEGAIARCLTCDATNGGSERKTMTTYKRTDGEAFGLDFAWATDMESVESEVEDRDDPLEFTEEVWVRVSVRHFFQFPTAFTCQIEDREPCEEDAVGWWRSLDGVWLSVCDGHELDGVVKN